MTEIDHSVKSISDKIALISELEHCRRHALRSMISPNIQPEDRLFYAMVADRARDIRRSYMQKELKDCPTELWCLAKSSAALRQLSYEVFSGDDVSVKEIDEFVDMIWERITGEDLSECEACKDDRSDTHEQKIA